MLEGIDALLYDIQDVPVRFATYISTLACAQEAAADIGLPFVVCDRPNPIGGIAVEGPMLDGVKELGAQAILVDNLDRFSRATSEEVKQDATALRIAGVARIVTANGRDQRTR